MSVFRVVFHTVSRANGKHEFMNFECAHQTIASLTSALEDGIVVGVRLYSNVVPGSSPRAFRVVDRAPYKLEQISVRSIEHLPVLLYDERGTPLHDHTSTSAA